MICRLCVEDITESIEIFSQDYEELNIAEIVNKYFWFEINENDAISTVICKSCWNNICGFHKFYQIIENAQAKLENFVKIEKCDLEDGIDMQIFLKDITADEHLNENLISANGYLAENCESVLKKGAFADNDNDPLKHTNNTDINESCELKYKCLSQDKDNTSCTKVFTAYGSNPPVILSPQKRKRGRPIQNNRHHSPNIKENDTNLNNNFNNEKIDEHIAKYMKLICDKCGYEQTNFAELRLHMRKKHKTKGYAVCCSKKFYKRNLLTHHIDKHLNPEQFKCEHCSRTFAAKHCLNYHKLLKHHPEEKKVYECQQCHKKFATEYILERHSIVHLERTHLCNICQKGFSTEQKLSHHVKYVHSNYGIMCDICAKVIIGRAAFKRHQLEHDGVQMPRQQCDVCGVWYKNEYILKKHKRTHLEDGEIHKCNECGKIAPTRRALLSHQRFVHFQQRVYDCSICGKAFKRALTLKEHMTLHTGEVLYNCPHCLKSFNSNSNMYSHRKKAHPEEFEKARKSRIVEGITKANKVIKPASQSSPLNEY